MKVKTGELKTHLSRYLREAGETGTPIEVCVREKTVAYLTPVSHDAETQTARDALSARLAAAGVTVNQWGRKPTQAPCPGHARDGRTAQNSVVAIREEKDW